ncbi:unnamed protein product, partial [Laminaria digitata]
GGWPYRTIHRFFLRLYCLRLSVYRPRSIATNSRGVSFFADDRLSYAGCTCTPKTSLLIELLVIYSYSSGMRFNSFLARILFVCSPRTIEVACILFVFTPRFIGEHVHLCCFFNPPPNQPPYTPATALFSAAPG